FGRTPDNDISFPDDSNVSRFHAEIERRGDDFWLIDLGSTNGTLLNDKPMKGESLLKEDDRIAFGGSSEVVFKRRKEEAAGSPSLASDAAAGMTSSPSGIPPVGRGSVNLPTGAAAGSPAMPDTASAANAAVAASGPSWMLLIAGGICGLALVFVAAAAIFYFTREEKCQARAVITKPESGDTIVEAVDVEAKAEDTECVVKAIYTIDGEAVAESTDPPYSVSIDPKDFPQFADGLDHDLQIVLIDEKGQSISQQNSVILAFETREIKKPEEDTAPIITAGDQSKASIKPTAKALSLLDIKTMADNLVKQFPARYQYDLSNPELLKDVRKRTAEYAQPGYYQRAVSFKDTINVAFVREQNLDAPFGFILAMSRSKFSPARQGTEEGLWRIPTELVTANAYNGTCGTETLSDPSQDCSAKATALYMKAIVSGVFEGDVVYGAAAFGKSPQDAAEWKASLPADRSNIWNSIASPQERDQAIRFFAAGIVAENPNKFGLDKDRPLSELYRAAL
ncbi:MAG: FHA domain-containing protein, partial [Pyrinomonadaceae bacterium]